MRIEMMKRATNLQELRDEMIGVVRGEREPSPRPVAPLLSKLSQETLELIAVLHNHKPETVGEVVRLTKRTQPSVSRSLQMLASYGLVRMVKVGREVRPEPTAARLVVDLTTGTYEAALVAGPDERAPA